jgi:hypothetical protein
MRDALQCRHAIALTAHDLGDIRPRPRACTAAAVCPGVCHASIEGCGPLYNLMGLATVDPPCCPHVARCMFAALGWHSNMLTDLGSRLTVSLESEEAVGGARGAGRGARRSCSSRGRGRPRRRWPSPSLSRLHASPP